MSEQQHLGELLSAHLDGELSADETQAVEAHLATCEACRQELEGTRSVRSALREAPAVDPPFGFFERMTMSRRRRPRWAAAASVACVAAAWVAVVGFAVSPTRETVEPPVAAARAALGNRPGVQVTMLRGKVEWSKLQGGLRRPVDGVPGTPWQSTDPFEPVAIVFEVEDTGILVVGNGTPEEVEAEAARVSEDYERSIVDRIRDAAASVVSWVL